MERVNERCLWCGAPLTGRRQQKFCTSACRQKAYRARRAYRRLEMLGYQMVHVTYVIGRAFPMPVLWEIKVALTHRLSTRMKTYVSVEFERRDEDVTVAMVRSQPERNREQLCTDLLLATRDVVKGAVA